MSKVIEEIRKELKSKADENVKRSGETFFREDVKLYGVKSALNTAIGKEHFKKLSDKSKETVFGYCEELWKSGIMEESFIACNWSYAVRKSFVPEDFRIFSDWVDKYVTNWASCDTFCNHTVGELIEMYPVFLNDLKVWARSENRWKRRASAVSLIVPARKGKFLEEIRGLADILLLDKDDMVQKGYGWMLKVSGQVYTEQIFNYVMKNKAVMPRTALRYAIEKFPPDLRALAMKK